MNGDTAGRAVPVLLKTVPEHAAVWHKVFAAEASHLALVDWSPDRDFSATRFAALWKPPDDIMDRAPDLELVFSVAAGLDHLPLDRLPGHVAVTRMVDADLTRTMTEYVLWAVLTLHRDLRTHLAEAGRGDWAARIIRTARSRTVGVMGLGVLGGAAARALVDLDFDVRGWSRSRKTISGVKSFAGEAEFGNFLSGCEILVCLLPLTEETTGILDRSLFTRLPEGAMLVNVGRGAHLNEDDLLDALSAGRISGAVLDVLAQEPPPPGHPLIEHPAVLVTPHVASVTQPDSAARQMIRAIEAVLRKERPENMVIR